MKEENTPRKIREKEEEDGGTKKRGRSKKNWFDTVKGDLHVSNKRVDGKSSRRLERIDKWNPASHEPMLSFGLPIQFSFRFSSVIFLAETKIGRSKKNWLILLRKICTIQVITEWMEKEAEDRRELKIVIQ